MPRESHDIQLTAKPGTKVGVCIWMHGQLAIATPEVCCPHESPWLDEAQCILQLLILEADAPVQHSAVIAIIDQALLEPLLQKAMDQV